MAMVIKLNAPETTVQAGEFKAKCLELMDRVAETGGAIVITKRGRPIARLVPVEPPARSIFGCAEGLLEITGSLELPRDRRPSVRKERSALLTDALLASGAKPRPAKKRAP